MYSYATERVVPADAGTVGVAIDDLVSTVWGPVSRVVYNDGLRRVDAVAADVRDEAADVWLGWQLTPLPSGTRVRLVLDELDPGPEPIEELSTVLDMLADRVRVAS